MSPDNQVRKQAEACYKSMLDTNPSLVAVQLLSQIGFVDGQDAMLRTFCAVLVRRVVDATGIFWSKIDRQSQESIRNQLIQTFQGEPVPSIRKKLAHAVACCASTGGWTSLVGGVAGLAMQQGDDGRRETALFLLEKLAEHAEEDMKIHCSALFQVYSSCVAESLGFDVRLAAVKAAVSLLIVLDEPSRAPFTPLLSTMLQVLSSGLTKGDEFKSQELLESFAEFARSAPLFFKHSLKEVVAAMLTVSGSTQLDFATRAIALEVIVTLCEAAPAQMRKCQELTQGIFPLCLTMAIELEQSEAEWVLGSYNEMVDMDEDAVVGEEALERVSTSLGAKVSLPAAMQFIPSLTSSADFRQRRAAASFLGRLTDGVSKGLKAHVSNVLTILVPLMKDQSQRVRYQAMQCIGRMADVYGGSFQQDYHGVLLPILAENIASDSLCARLRGHACSALISFCHPEKCEREVLQPYLNVLLQALCTALQNTPTSVQEVALTAVACIAQVSEEDFAGFYALFIPGIKSILYSADSPDLAGLRGKAMECIGLICDSVSSDVFQQDAVEILKLLMTLAPKEQAPLEYVAPACARMCKAIGSESAQYLPLLLPPIFAALDAEVQFELEDADDVDIDTPTNTESGLDSISLNIRGIGNKRVSMNTHAVFEKSSACRLLYEYATTFKGSFVSYVEQVAQRLFPLVGFTYSEEVRSSASLALGQVFGCLVLGMQQMDPQSADSNKALTLSNTLLENAIYTFVVTGLKDEPREEARTCMGEGIKEILKYCFESGGGLVETGVLSPPRIYLSLDKAKAATILLGARASESLVRRQEIEQSFDSAEQFDAEDQEHLDEILANEEELMANIVDSIGYILKCHKENFIPIFEEVLFPLFAPILAEAHRYHPSIVTNAVCIFDDCIEWCGVAASRYAQECLPMFIACLSHEHFGLKQASIYGIIQIAKSHPSLLKRDINQITNKLVQIIECEDALDDENIGVTENAVSAIGTISSNSDLVGGKSAILFKKWLAMLPLKSDEAEARVVHRQLCDLIEANNPHIIGDSSNIPTVIKTMVEVISSNQAEDTFIADQTTVQRMKQILQSIQQSVPQVFQSTWDMLPDAQRAAFA